MSRIHIMINVANLAESTEFYQSLLGSVPTKQKSDYVQWKLKDPSLNLSLKSNPHAAFGVDHLGLEADNEAELAELSERVNNIDEGCCGTGKTVCCYAKSDKSWASDPSGLAWELFFTHADHPTYSEVAETAN